MTIVVLDGGVDEIWIDDLWALDDLLSVGCIIQRKEEIGRRKNTRSELRLNGLFYVSLLSQILDTFKGTVFSLFDFSVLQTVYTPGEKPPNSHNLAKKQPVYMRRSSTAPVSSMRQVVWKHLKLQTGEENQRC